MPRLISSLNQISNLMKSFLEPREDVACKLYILCFGIPFVLLGLTYLLNYRQVMHLYECLQNLDLLWTISLH